MFDKYIVVEDSLKRVPGGVQFGVRLPYYRGLGLSMVETMDVTVDGERVPEENLTVTLGDRTVPFEKRDDETDTIWNFGEIATVTARLPHELGPGEHQVGVNFGLRISYFPVPMVGQDAKTLKLVD